MRKAEIWQHGVASSVSFAAAVCKLFLPPLIHAAAPPFPRKGTFASSARLQVRSRRLRCTTTISRWARLAPRIIAQVLYHSWHGVAKCAMRCCSQPSPPRLKPCHLSHRERQEVTVQNNAMINGCYAHPRRDKAQRGMAFTHILNIARSSTIFSPLRAAIGGAWLRTASSTRRYKSPCALGFLGCGSTLSRQGGDGGVGGLRGARRNAPQDL